jgi:hypothetical protein
LEFNPLSLTQKNGDCAWVWRKILHLGGIIGPLLDAPLSSRVWKNILSERLINRDTEEWNDELN